MSDKQELLSDLSAFVADLFEIEELTPKQLYALEDYYEQAKIYYSENDRTTALAILKRLKTMPVHITQVKIVRAKAEGYSDAIMASVSRAGLSLVDDVQKHPMDKNESVEVEPKSVQPGESKGQENRKRPPVDDI